MTPFQDVASPIPYREGDSIMKYLRNASYPCDTVISKGITEACNQIVVHGRHVWRDFKSRKPTFAENMERLWHNLDWDLNKQCRIETRR